jgi:uncharacterized protein (TIGR02145 family)
LGGDLSFDGVSSQPAGSSGFDGSSATLATSSSAGASHLPVLLDWGISPRAVTIGDTLRLQFFRLWDGAGYADIAEFRWDLDGDGTYERSRSDSATQLAVLPAGTHLVSVQVVDSQGASATDTAWVDVLQGIPLLRALADTTVGIGQELLFTSQWSDPNQLGSIDLADGPLTQLRWDYEGDGVFDDSLSHSAEFRHAFPDSNASRVWYAVACGRDDDANTRCDTTRVTVRNCAPQVGAIWSNRDAYSYTLDTALVVFWVPDSLYTDADGNRSDSLWWDLEGDGIVDKARASGDTVVWAYGMAGTNAVRVIGRDRWGAADTLERSFLRVAAPPQPCVAGKVSDARDGKQYDCVTIGSQTWMAENVNFGVQIDSLSSPSRDGVVEKYCSGDSPTICTNAGGLYEWREALGLPAVCGNQSLGSAGCQLLSPHQGACPSGWHIPSVGEWVTLKSWVDGDNGGVANDEGQSLKSTTYWTGTPGNGVNTYGFNALPVGGLSYRSYAAAGTNFATWWSVNEVSHDWANYMHLWGGSGTMVQYANEKMNIAYGVRCLRD